VLGEHDENELRKAFTVSERVAIALAVRAQMGERRGRPAENSQNIGGLKGTRTDTVAAERAGFGNAETMRQAERVLHQGAPELVHAVDAGDVSISAAAVIAELPADEQRAIVNAGPSEVVKAAKAVRERRGVGHRTSVLTGEPGWRTPAEYVELARQVLGDIDLDPASSALAQETVKAALYYSEAEDGLADRWSGRVWLNPPYCQPAIGQFVDKRVTELAIGNVESAILLVNNNTDTAWFQKAAASSSSICFPRRRIRFKGGVDRSPVQGQSFSCLRINLSQLEKPVRHGLGSHASPA
jgi:ParB family transcriptional regulator, chromosome partitioning protein